jgi:hypothetical protein
MLGVLPCAWTEAAVVARTLTVTSPNARSDLHDATNGGAYV